MVGALQDASRTPAVPGVVAGGVAGGVFEGVFEEAAWAESGSERDAP